ncbi:AcrR family transcriptional regulator [Kitasatospora gansuensis]|uniref:AcrR family transcriptional regulator n=1 Tax=Kitasatospora gansuensis TaxID=258050 RepID=A0A7W7WHB9_9ACTN|nr:TetR/AcrR family transcriptional regulator [Kitasatospora gansuensis]MBB4947607.1 AcrR family transcriptional regulator [Kitasatospora gansuensis]
MTDQDQLLGLPVPSSAGEGPVGHGVVPEQRGPLQRESYGAPGAVAPAAAPAASADEPGGTARLRVDARRNLESVLRAARQVFGELGYGAPMEEVARRAGVGVGTVYRRFPSKEVLVQRIAAEEVAWLTAQAKESLYGGAGPWESLAGYLSRAVGSGAGRLLPPSAFRYADELATFRDAADVPQVQVPVQRGSEPVWDSDPRQLLHLLAALVARAAAAGELRPGVTVSDVVLVLTAAVPVHARPVRAEGDESQPQDTPGERLLHILLNGLRAR